MSSAIPSEFTQFVQQELASGRFQSTEEVVGEGLRLLRERRRQELQQQLRVGMDQLDGGEGIELDDAELAGFLDDIEAEVRRELAAGKTEKP